MIRSLSIEWFKSIRSLQLDCRRVNVFIGEPNTGKSNILEALGVLSFYDGLFHRQLKDFVRFENMADLFFDGLVEDAPIRIQIQNQDGTRGQIEVSVSKNTNSFFYIVNGVKAISLDAAAGGSQVLQTSSPYFGERIKFYRYFSRSQWNFPQGGPLDPPHGQNLFAVVQGTQVLRNKLVSLLKPYGWTPVLKRYPTYSIEIQKSSGGLAISLPWNMVSDTLQRILFYSAAIVSNENSTLVLEEPEAHAFPYYVKHLGEYIALHSSNQFFLATHNPYFLTALIEKTSKEDLAVFAVRYRRQETEVHLLSDSQIQQSMEQDPFLSLENIFGD